MSKKVFEDAPAPTPSGGNVDKVRKAARQLAYDVRYKVKGQFKDGQKTDASSLKRAYLQQLNKSPAPAPVKILAKKMLIGEEYDSFDLTETAKINASCAYDKVFKDGYRIEEVEEVEEEAFGTKFTIRVTDKKTKKTYYRKADRAKISELRKNPNIGSVEITGRKEKDTYDKTGKNSGDKKAKKDYDGDGKVESGSKEHAGAVHNAIQRKKGGVADGQDTRKEEYVDEGLRSAVKRLLGKKDAPAEKKPESRGEQLRKKYNVGPEKSDTSAKRQILDRTRAKAERDQKQYGGSVYTKSVADKSKAAHDRYLKGGYSKYGADDRRGSGNKARRRAEALKKEDFNWLVDTLISEGYNLSSYTVDQFYDFCEEVIYEKEEGSEKKLDTMKGKNKVVINPKLGEEAEKNEVSPEDKKQIEMKKRMLQKKMMMQKQAMQMQKQGKLALNYAEESNEIRYCPKCDKDETRDECKYGGEYWDENSKPAKAVDPRAVPTMVNLVKNKMRARGLNMSYEPELNQVEAKDPFADKPYDKFGRSKDPKARKKAQEKASTLRNQDRQSGRRIYGTRLGYDKKEWDESVNHVEESAEDRLRDFRQERGGVDGNKRYDRPPARKATNKEFGIRDFTSAEKEKRAKEITSHFKKMRR